MERNQISALVKALILATLLVSPVVQAQDGGGQSVAEPDAAQTPPDTGALAPLKTGFTYQGRLDENGSPVNDDCDMVFRLFDQQIGGTQISSSITKTVSIVDGLFTVNLDFGADAFDGDRRWLKISVDCEQDGTYTPLGRKVLTPAPYALYAVKSGGPQNVVTVAQSGGDYSSIQAAIDNITDATASNPYLVWVAPGMYDESVTMKPYVHLQGTGHRATIINSTAASSSWPPGQATLILTHTTSLRDLTVRNNGTGSHNAALLAMDGTHHALVADVIVRARGSGSGSYNYSIFLAGGDTDVTLMHVTAVAENGFNMNCGLYNIDGAEATLHSGSFTGRGGTNSRGIFNGDATLEATGVTALGENGSLTNCGLLADSTVETTLRGGSFTGRGGDYARGIRNSGSGAVLEASGITALAENGGGTNRGLDNSAIAEVDSSRLIGSDYGLYLNTGTVRLAITQLDGGAYNDSGTLTCFQVYDENYAAYSCP